MMRRVPCFSTWSSENFKGSRSSRERCFTTDVDSRKNPDLELAPI
jgi:hypothetical protein